MASVGPGSLITHLYSDFRGVDYTNEEVSLYRSPDSLNVWKDYSKLGRCIETRPGLELLVETDNTIHGLFFYTIGSNKMILVHCGTKLYKYSNNSLTLLKEGLKPAKSQSFIYNNIFYLKDGLNYLRYDGIEVTDVVGYVPTTFIGCRPQGGGTKYQDVNMLSDYRINKFSADGESTEYKLTEESIDRGWMPEVKVNDVIVHNFTVNYDEAKITFDVAPEEPLTTGQDNVEIKYKKHVADHADRIKKCTLLEVFDNRVFFSGNIDFPNVIFHSSLNDPTYCADLDYYNEGLDAAKVKGLVSGNNALWVFKEPSQANTTIFYHNPTIDSQYGKIFPSSHSSISTGCVGAAINFGDDICFFSDEGMEAISQDITTEQVLRHRSSYIDSKLLKEENYKDMILTEWKGYLLVCIGNHIYLADSNQDYVNYPRYEWFYWEMEHEITYATVYEGILYLGTNNGIYKLTDNSADRNVDSYWSTTYDEFGYQFYQKTTNKRGFVADLIAKHIDVYVKTDSVDYELINNADNISSYLVTKIKRKKWKGIQLKFVSNKPFELYSCSLQAYIGGYIKR